MTAWGKGCVGHKRKKYLKRTGHRLDRREKKRDILRLLKPGDSSLTIRVFPRLSSTSAIL